MNQSFNLCVATETIVNDAQQLGVTVDELQRICINVSAQVIQQPSLHLQANLSTHPAQPTASKAAKLVNVAASTSKIR